MTYRGVSAAVVHLLMSARSNGVPINRTKLAKLLYLADLRAVDEGLAPGTDVEWRWRHYGPYSNVLLGVEEDLETAGVIQVAEAETYFGGTEHRLRLLLEAPQVEIDAKFMVIVDHMVQEYGRLSATQLKDLTYQTPPMAAAQRLGEREVRLDLTGGDPFPNLAPALARLRRVARDLPPLDEDEPGAVEALAAEMDDWAHLRGEANDQLLGGE
ncbi:type II toxin-antitoxin system antitoxin SocA domain-containing protein [Streptomyces sp. NPDC001118]